MSVEMSAKKGGKQGGFGKKAWFRLSFFYENERLDSTDPAGLFGKIFIVSAIKESAAGCHQAESHSGTALMMNKGRDD